MFDDKSDDTWYDDGERYTRCITEDNSQFSRPIDDADQDAVYGAIADGIDNDGDSDDFDDLNQNGIPDFLDSNNNGSFDTGETLEPGVKWLGGQYFYVYADGMDNDGDGQTDENIDEGIDEVSEDNRYTVNELSLIHI